MSGESANLTLVEITNWVDGARGITVERGIANHRLRFVPCAHDDAVMTSRFVIQRNHAHAGGNVPALNRRDRRTGWQRRLNGVHARTDRHLFNAAPERARNGEGIVARACSRCAVRKNVRAKSICANGVSGQKCNQGRINPAGETQNGVPNTNLLELISDERSADGVDRISINEKFGRCAHSTRVAHQCPLLFTPRFN